MSGGDRYAAMFARLAERGEGAFVPFLVLGDPDLETSARLLDALVDGGADAVELGIPFSDPIADGPTIQEATLRALDAGVTPPLALELVRDFRKRHPSVPIGLLVYANLVVGVGRDAFYRNAAEAGVDSVLIADVPAFEVEPFAAAARAAGIAPVMILPPTGSGAVAGLVERIAEFSDGYTYCVARTGVTGADQAPRLSGDQGGLPDLSTLERHGAPPPVVGFGISTPAHVVAALEAGARGAISGSAIVRLARAALADGPEAASAAIADFVRSMKDATRR